MRRKFVFPVKAVFYPKAPYHDAFLLFFRQKCFQPQKRRSARSTTTDSSVFARETSLLKFMGSGRPWLLYPRTSLEIQLPPLSGSLRRLFCVLIVFSKEFDKFGW